MKTRFASLALLATSVVVSFAVTATANTDKWGGAKPMFKVIPNNAPGHIAPIHPAAQLTQWQGSFKDHHGNTVSYTMVGTDPNSTNTSTTVKVIVIPLKMVYGSSNGNMTFNVKRDKYSNGQTVLSNMKKSPIFQSGIDFVQGGVDVGNTQYIDAYQRANFWQTNVQNEPNYHVLLNISQVEKPFKISVSAGQGKVIRNPFGTINVGTMDINAFDSAINSYMTSHSEITPDTLPLFVSDNIYLTSGGGCCIGGYHSARGGAPSGQTYSYTTLVTEAKSFSQDVSALSHEVGEWMDDPFTTNRVHCNDNSIMENGDPLVQLPNYGGYPYKLNGFTYNLQDLVFIGYFGSPDVSVNNWRDFQNAKPGDLCPGQ